MADNCKINFKNQMLKHVILIQADNTSPVSRTIKPQGDLITWKLTRQFLQTQAWT